MGIGHVHYFVLVGNVEIREVAGSVEYRKDKRI
jgi:hypothetical protein